MKTELEFKVVEFIIPNKFGYNVMKYCSIRIHAYDVRCSCEAAVAPRTEKEGAETAARRLLRGACPLAASDPAIYLSPPQVRNFT